MRRGLMAPRTDCPVRCRVPGYYEACSERARACQLNKYWQLLEMSLKNLIQAIRETVARASEATHVIVVESGVEFSPDVLNVFEACAEVRFRA